MRRSTAIRTPGGLVDRARVGKRPFGTIVALADPASTVIFGRAGFDFVILDCEHGPLSVMDVGNHVRAAEACGTIPLVRVRDNSASGIGAMLDAGAHGVVVPHVDDAAAARAAVAATRYAPVGVRGKCPGCYGADYSPADWKAHWPRANAEAIAIPIIESVRAVQNIEEIVAVDGVDIVLFGPGDLGQEMGLTDGDALIAAWVRVRDAAHAAGKLAIGSRGRGFEGSDLILASMDVLLLRRVANEIARDCRNEGAEA